MGSKSNYSGRFFCVDGFAEEQEELVYEGLSNWFVSFRSMYALYQGHFSYIIVFFSMIGCGILSYKHAVENGPKNYNFWCGAVLYAVLIDPGFSSKYWHAQGPIMLFGKRLPLHIIFYHASIIYLCMVAIQKLKLLQMTEPIAAALLALLMDIPYKIISVKFMHVTYHDTDPSYSNKLFGVPFIELLCSVFLTSSYIATFYKLKIPQTFQSFALFESYGSTLVNSKDAFMICLVAFTSPIIAFMQKLLLFHALNDFFNIDPASCLFFTISLYVFFIFCYESRKSKKIVPQEGSGKLFLFYQLVLYSSCLLYITFFGKPQNEISVGVHEQTGDCTTMLCSRSPLGKPLKRKKYLCADDVASRKNFIYNFDCLEEGPPGFGAIWYTICGTPILNRNQFVINMISFLLLVISFYLKVLFYDVKKIEAAKRLVVKLKREKPALGSSSSVDEVTVGFVFVKQDSNLIPQSFQLLDKKIK